VQERFGPSAIRLFAAFVPFGFGLIAAAIANFPVSLSGGILPTPMLAMMPVYFWCLVRPDLMPVWAAFLVGVAEDLLCGGPPGIWGAAFVACYAFVDRERDALAGLAGYGAILGFAAAMLVTGGTAYALVALYFVKLPPVAPLIAGFAVNIFWYIPALWLMNAVQRRVIGPLRSDI
jgi:rod shape-determining protein MreD